MSKDNPREGIGPMKPILSIFLVIVWIIVAFMLVSTSEVDAKTITVDDDGDADYKDIQDAIDNASSGDTIRIWSGTYSENVIIEKPLSIIGNGTNATLLTTHSSKAVITVRSDWCNITDLAVIGNQAASYGIDLEGTNNSIHNIRCSGNTIDGIKVSYSSNNMIDNIHADNNSYRGIQIFQSTNILVESSTFHNNTRGGITISESIGVILHSSILSENGIIISGAKIENWNTHEISVNNTVNSNPVMYFRNKENLKLNNTMNCTILSNCTNVSISYQEVHNTTYGLCIGFSNQIRIANSRFENNYAGVVIHSSNNCILLNTTCRGNAGFGIGIWNSNNCVLYGSNSSNNNHGILVTNGKNYTVQRNEFYRNKLQGVQLKNIKDSRILDNSIRYSKDNGIRLEDTESSTIFNNTIEYNGFGLLMISGITSFRTKFNLIEKNAYQDNDLALRLYSCRYNTILNNSIHNSKGTAISLSNSDENEITHNVLMNNGGSGIYLDYSDSVQIIDNSVHQNNKGIYLKTSKKVLMESNSILGNSNGIYAWGYSGDVKAHNNSIFFNEIGVDTTANHQIALNVTENWWGDPSGPNETNDNPEGVGDIIRGPSEYRPWLNARKYNEKPTLSTHSTTEWNEDEFYRILYSADDTDVLRWRMETNASFIKFNATSHELSGLPLGSHIGAYYVNISVDDSEYTDSHNFTLLVRPVNDYPLIDTEFIPNGTEDLPYYHLLNATDEEKDILVWSIVTNASFLSIDENTGAINGTPTGNDIGLFWVDITVSDSFVTSSSNFTLFIMGVNDNPIINGNPPQTILEDHNYSINFSAIDEEHDPITWGITTNAQMISFDPQSGILSISPSESDIGEHWVNISASDGKASSFLNFSIEVIAVNDHPKITIIDFENGTIICSYSHLTGESYDSDSDELQSQVSINDGPWENFSTEESWEYNLSIDLLNPGENSISFRSYDGELYSNRSSILIVLNDLDNDKVCDEFDAFPEDPAASEDGDGDGYPDKWNPGKVQSDSTNELELDAFPDDPEKWKNPDDDSQSERFPIPLVFIWIIIALCIILIILRKYR